jgi:hypothetical protein
MREIFNCRLVLVGYLLVSLYDPEDRGSVFLHKSVYITEVHGIKTQKMAFSLVPIARAINRINF